MEAIAAFSLACNVIQVLDSATKIVSLSLDLYKNGILTHHADLEHECAHLDTMYTTLCASLSMAQCSSTSTAADGEIRILANECCVAVADLRVILDSLKFTGTRWSALMRSMSVMRKRTKIEKLRDKIEKLQSLLSTGILIRIREQNDAIAQTQRTDFRQLDTALQTFIQNLADQQDRVTKHVAKEHVATQGTIQSEHLQTRSQLNDQLRNLRLSENSEKLCARLLGSFRLDTMYARQNHVSGTAYDTFEWIFKDRPQQFWPSMTEWLTGSNGTYRIQGKAGSGKSTFMKFLQGHEKTQECLQVWAPQSRPKIVSHFFWRAGAPTQGDLRGFLCSVLYQILDDEINLLTWILQESPAAVKKHGPFDWDVKELSGLLPNLLSKGPPTVRCLLLIDGLDEFYDNVFRDDFFELLSKLFSLTNIKICIAHRPEPDLERFLNHIPLLRLQDLTYSDIQTYAEGRLAKMVESLDHEVNVDALKLLGKDVTYRSNGVFLWVRLVLDDIARGVRGQDTLDGLRYRLMRLPADIEKLYENMLQRLGEDWKVYQAEAAFYLKACYLNGTHQSWARYPLTGIGSQLSVLSMTLALDRLDRGLTDVGDFTSSTEVLIDKCARLESRIRLCCSGLLEIDYDIMQPPIVIYFALDRPAQRVFEFGSTAVKFMHRTVFDFLESPGGTDILAKTRVDNSQIFVSAIQANLICGLQQPSTRDRFAQISAAVDYLACGAWIASYSSDTIWSILLMIKEYVLQFGVPKNLEGVPYEQRVSEFRFCQNNVYSDLTGYFLYRGLGEAFTYGFEDVIQRRTPHSKRLNLTYLHHLLDCVLSQETSRFEHSHWPKIRPKALCPWRPLVNAGADLNAEVLHREAHMKGYMVKTPWVSFVESGPSRGTSCPAEVAGDLLQHGVNLGRRILVAVCICKETDDHHVHLNPLGSNEQSPWTSLFVVIVEAEIDLLFRSVVGPSQAQALVARNLLPDNLNSKPKPLLIIPVGENLPPWVSHDSDRNENGQDEVGTIDNDDDGTGNENVLDQLDRAAGIIDSRESCDQILAFLTAYELHMTGKHGGEAEYFQCPRSNPDPLHLEVEKIFERSNKTTLRKWLIETGRLLPYEHPDAPKGPYKQFDDPIGT